MRKPMGTLFAVLMLAVLCAPAPAADCAREDCGWDEAVKYCDGKGGSLPTTDDLLKAWEAKCTGGKTAELCSGWYWSSRSRNSAQAWGVSFKTGEVGSYRKTLRAPVYCGPKTPRKTAAKKAAAKKGEAEKEGERGDKCASGPCNWFEAVSYCQSIGLGQRLYTLKELHTRLCPDECAGDQAPESCKKWFWLSNSDKEGYALSGSCDVEGKPGAASVAKSSLVNVRCARW